MNISGSSLSATSMQASASLISSTATSEQDTQTNRPSAAYREPERNSFGRSNLFTTLLSRTTPTRSDDEILEAAREQARIDFANGVFQVSEGFGALNREFVSSVSPDRVGMMRNTMKASPFSANQQRPLQLWEILLKLEKGSDALPVSSLKRTPTGEVESMIIVDTEGNPIINFAHDRGWIEVFSPAESERAREILRVYNDEWLAMRNLAETGNSRFEQIPSDLGVGVFDSMA